MCWTRSTSDWKITEESQLVELPAWGRGQRFNIWDMLKKNHLNIPPFSKKVRFPFVINQSIDKDFLLHPCHLCALHCQHCLIAARAYLGFCSMKWLGVFLLPLDGILVHRRSLPRNLLGFPNNSPVPIYTPGVPIYTPGWSEALWELSVLPKNTTQYPLAWARTRTARSGDERTNHEATTPPTKFTV